MLAFCRYREVVAVGQRRRYAWALVTSLLAAAGVAGCGMAPPGSVAPPTTDAGARGVTAPATGDTGLPPPVFTGSDPAATSPSSLAAPPSPSSSLAAPPQPPRSPAAGLRVVQVPIPYSASRQQEMAAYSLRHYGTASWQLTPTMIVLHYTAGGSWSGARATFVPDTVNMGELPGVCSHYVVDKDGTVYQLVPTSIRCRHTIGLNDQAIGIEMVQEGGSSASWADQQVLGRPAQVGAALALVRSLQAQFGIPTGSVIGHAMANAAPQFHDRLGWRNDHADWQPADVEAFRARL